MSETATKALAWMGARALGIATLLWQAFVFTRLWAWFVAPLGVPGIGMPHALGIMLTIGLLRSMGGKVSDKTLMDYSAEMCGREITVALALVVGWALAGMMP